MPCSYDSAMSMKGLEHPSHPLHPLGGTTGGDQTPSANIAAGGSSAVWVPPSGSGCGRRRRRMQINEARCTATPPFDSVHSNPAAPSQLGHRPALSANIFSMSGSSTLVGAQSVAKKGAQLRACQCTAPIVVPAHVRLNAPTATLHMCRQQHTSRRNAIFESHDQTVVKQQQRIRV